MKLKLIIFLITISFTVLIIKAQDTTSYYIDTHGVETQKENTDGVRNIISIVDDSIYLVKDYYLDGKLKKTGKYLDKDSEKRTGKFISYFKNGQVKSTSNYIDGKENGKTIVYYENGAVKSSIDYLDSKEHGKVITFWENWAKKREDNFENGLFIDGKCFDNAGKEIKHFDYLVLPSFPGGEKDFFQFLGRNTQYPKEARENNIQGVVYVSFIVSKEGYIENINIIRGVHPLLYNEALRVVSIMPKWIPGKKDGEAVSVRYNLPIRFDLS